jgi:hypothetical protein
MSMKYVKNEMNRTKSGGNRIAMTIVLHSQNGRSQYCSSPSKKAGKIANIMRSVSLLAWDSTHFA